MDPATTGEGTSAQAARHRRELKVLSASYLATQDRCEVLSSQLLEERCRRLHDLAALQALDDALAQSKAVTVEFEARCAERDRQIDRLDEQLRIAQTHLAELRAAQSAEAWSPHVLRLRSVWRRLPAWVRGPVHILLDRVGRALDRR